MPLQYLEQGLDLIPTQIDVNARLYIRLSRQAHEPPQSKTGRNSRAHKRKRVWDNFRHNQIDIGA